MATTSIAIDEEALSAIGSKDFGDANWLPARGTSGPSIYQVIY
jgi:hypothetical protein